MAYIAGDVPSKKPAAPTTLAKKPAAPKTTYLVTAPAPAAPAAAAAGAGGAAAGGGSLWDTASAHAAAETNAVVAGIVAQQQAAYQQAALRAAQQGQLGIATSKYLEGLDIGGAVAGDYAHAAAAQRAAAAGYSGGLQQTVSDAAAGVQANLNAIGGPQTATNQGAAAGKVLYGLGGDLPSTQLDVVGPTVAAGLRALPAQMLGYGQLLAAGELGQGQQEAAKLTPEIVAARAQQPTLAGKYLDSLETAAATARQNAFDNAIAQAKVNQDAASAQETASYHAQSLAALNQWRNAQIDLANAKAAAPQFHNVGGNLYAYSPSTGKLTLAATAPAKPITTKDGFGRVISVAPDGTQTVLTSGSMRGADGAVYQVGTDDTLTPLIAGRAPTPQTQIVTLGNEQWLVDKATGAKIRRIGNVASSTSTAAPTTKTINGVTYQWNAGTRKWVKSGLPAGTATKPKPYEVSSGAFSNAVSVAKAVRGGSGAANPLYAALGLAPPASEKPGGWGEAMRRVSAYLRGAGVKQSFIASTARNALISAGYVPPGAAAAATPGIFGLIGGAASGISSVAGAAARGAQTTTIGP